MESQENKKAYTITNEHPSSRLGGIGMYIQGIKEVLGDKLDLDIVYEFPSRFRLIRFLMRRTNKKTEIWTHHIFPIGFAAYIISKIRRQPYIVFLHGNDFDSAQTSKKRRILMKYIVRSAKRVVVNSEALQKDLQKETGVKAVVVNPWLPTDIQERIQEVNTQKDKTILTMSRFVWRKGFEVMIEVARRLPEYKILFLGPCNDYAKKLEGIIKEQEVENVEIRYNTKDPKEARSKGISAIEKCRYFAMPTHKTPEDREGFGITYLEAQYAGKPVIAVSHEEVKAAISPKLHEYLAEATTAEEVVRQIRNMERDHVTEMANELREYVERHHTLASRKNSITELLYD